MSEEDELKALFLAGAAGDGAAHGRFLRRAAPRLRAYLRRQLPRLGVDPAEAEDFLQETLLAIHSKRHAYDSAYPVLAWATAIARYKLIDGIRKRQRSPAAARAPLEAALSLPGPDDHASVAAAADLHRLLDQLPLQTQAAIRDVKLEGLSVAESAQRRGMSESLVKVNIHRGLKRIAELLGLGAGT